MKRLLATAALALSLTTAAHAAATKLNASGKWTSYVENDLSVCGMQTRWPDRTMYVKYYKGAIRIHLFKNSWRLEPGTKLKIRFQVDADAPQEFTAAVTGFENSQATAINIAFAPETSAEFLRQFEEANTWTISFPDGDEPSWRVSMEGSRVVSSVFKRCIAYKEANKPTSPVAPTSPTSPKAKAAKKDDGGI